jgi:uncharacterized protein (DUF305 family)
MKKKNKKTTPMILALLAILVIAGGVWMFALRDSEDASTSSTTQSAQQAAVDIPVTEAEKNFATYYGEDYDRYLLANMIAHHEGAIDMAKQAQTKAKHSELKTLANNIISSQTKEKDDMLAWQQAWDYPASSGEMMMDHSAMGMMGEMDAMTAELEPLSGDAFDKKFLELMIEHHMSAVGMARPGLKNALHSEVKKLVQDIITAQTSEIAQMRQWQKDWGYVQ